MGFFGKVWGGVKKAAGVAGKLAKQAIQNKTLRSGLAKGVGIAASMIPGVGPLGGQAIQKFAEKGLDKINDIVNKTPEGNVKSGLEHIEDMADSAKDVLKNIPALGGYQGTFRRIKNVYHKIKDEISKANQNKTNQYTSPNAVSAGGEGAVWSQTTQPIVRTDSPAGNVKRIKVRRKKNQ